MDSIVYILQNLHWFVLLVGGLVFFHEFGHFLVAKLCGVKVQRFSLGFGPKLVGFVKGETEYWISLLPLGGYVKMLGEMPGTEVAPEDKPRAFEQKPVWQRTLIVAAGPGFNFLLAFIVLFFVFFGQQTAISTKLGYVVPGDPAWQAGLRAGDEIVAVDGAPIEHWSDLRDAVGTRPGEQIEVTVLHNGQRKTVTVQPEPHKEKNALRETVERGLIGVSPVYVEPVVAVVDPNSPAARAGIETGDRITGVNGEAVETWFEVRRQVQGIPEGKAIELDIQRGEASIERRLEPVASAPDRLRPNGLEDVALPLLSSADTAWGYTGLVSKNTIVETVEDETPAAETGLQPGDRLLRIATEDAEGGRLAQPVAIWSQDLRGFQGMDASRTFEMTFQRGDSVLTRQLQLVEKVETDEFKNQRKRVVFGATNDRELTQTYTTELQLGPLEAARASGAEVWRDMSLIGRLLGKLVQGEVSFDTMGGPIMLFVIAEKTAERGALEFIRALAFISVNLGLVNLFPIPALDGGHLLFFGIEAIRREPPSPRVREVANLAGFMLLLLLMVIIITNDIIKVSG